MEKLQKINRKGVSNKAFLGGFPSKNISTPGWWSYQPQISEAEANILTEAQFNLNNAWEPMALVIFPIAILLSQLFVYKTLFDLWLRNRWWHRKTMLAKT